MKIIELAEKWMGKDFEENNISEVSDAVRNFAEHLDKDYALVLKGMDVLHQTPENNCEYARKPGHAYCKA